MKHFLLDIQKTRHCYYAGTSLYSWYHPSLYDKYLYVW